MNFLDSLSPGDVSIMDGFVISQWAWHGQQDEQRLLWFRKKRFPKGTVGAYSQ